MRFLRGVPIKDKARYCAFFESILFHPHQTRLCAKPKMFAVAIHSNVHDCADGIGQCNKGDRQSALAVEMVIRPNPQPAIRVAGCARESYDPYTVTCACVYRTVKSG